MSALQPIALPATSEGWSAWLEERGRGSLRTAGDQVAALKTEPVNDLPPAPPGEVLRGVGSGRCVDVPGFSTTSGTALDLWDCNGGGNQAWNWTADKQLTVYGDKCMAIGGDGASAGNPVIIADCTGAANQAWQLNDDLSVTSVADPGLCLDASGAGTGNGTAVDVWYCNGQSNQQWSRS